MPNNVVKSFAEKSGKSVAEVEKLWKQAKAIAAKEHPEISPDSDQYYALVTGILKKSLKLKESFADTLDQELDTINQLSDEVTKNGKAEEKEEEGAETQG